MDTIPGLTAGHYQGLDAWLIQTDQAHAVISKVGGQLLSWRPAGEEEVLWVSPRLQSLPVPIRGGTPVCWPYFGRQGQADGAPSHGFVRTLPWTMAHARLNEDGSLRLQLQPSSLDGCDLALQMELVIGRTLQQRLLTRNTGVRSRQITQALHNYFHVSDVGQVAVEGLDGLAYQDKYAGGGRFEQSGLWQLADPRDPGRCDRIYGNAKGRYVIHDPGLQRRILITTTGSRSVVVWNPGQETAAGMPDVGDAWPGYVCVEPANAGDDVVILAPGADHVLSQRLRVTR